MNEASDFEKRVHQTVEHIANHPPFTSPWDPGQTHQLTNPYYGGWAGDPAYMPQQVYWTSPICPHCGKCRYCGR